MSLPNAIATTSERPQNLRRAAGGACYESFTLNALLAKWLPRIFAGVMTGRKHESRTATAGGFCHPARAQTTISAAMSFSACNLLFLTPTSNQLLLLTTVN